MTITARFGGKCTKCGGTIRPGDSIEWAKGKGATHATKCPEHSQPVQVTKRQPAAHEPTKRCWECGRTFTRRTMFPDGDWAEGYCGC